MKRPLIALAILLGIILAVVLPGLSPRLVSAQVCYNGTRIVPCPESEKRNKTPVVYPSFTPTATTIPTATPTIETGLGDAGYGATPANTEPYLTDFAPGFGLFVIGSLVIFVLGIAVFFYRRLIYPPDPINPGQGPGRTVHPPEPGSPAAIPPVDPDLVGANPPEPVMPAGINPSDPDMPVRVDPTDPDMPAGNNPPEPDMTA